MENSHRKKLKQSTLNLQRTFKNNTFDTPSTKNHKVSNDNNNCSSVVDVEAISTNTARSELSCSDNEQKKIEFFDEEKTIARKRLRQFLVHLLSAKVSLERLSNETIQRYCGKNQETNNTKTLNGSNEATSKILNPASVNKNLFKCKNYATSSTPRGSTLKFTKRYCPKCDTVFEHDKKVLISEVQICKQCDSATNWQCIRCNRRYPVYHSVKNHIRCHKDSKGSSMLCKIPVTPDSCGYRVVKISDQLTNVAGLTNRHCVKCDVSTSHSVSTVDVQTCTRCKSPTKLQCLKCCAKYDNYSQIHRHLVKVCHVKNQFKCLSCNYDTTCSSLMWAHVKKTHMPEDERYKCPKCCKKIKSKLNFESHVSLCGKPRGVFKCKHCSFKTLAGEKYFKIHMKIFHSKISAETNK